MDLRSANYLHFINAIKDGVVEKIRNVDSCGRPGFVFKALKDIYESEDVNKHAKFSKDRTEDGYEAMEFDTEEVKTGRLYPPIIQRKLKKRGRGSEKFDSMSESEKESDSDDINYGEITLKQLKKQCKVKSGKLTHFHSAFVKEEFADSQPEEDETDLNETISSWKSKKPKGRKRSFIKSAQTSSPVIFESIPNSKCPPQSGVGGLPSLVKVEISETECSEPIMISKACNSSVICSEQVVGLSGEVFGENGEDVENDSQSGNQLSLMEKSETCTVNEICYHHLEDIEDDVIMDCIEMTFTPLTNSSFPEHEESTMRNSIKEEFFFEAPLPFIEQSSDLHAGDYVLEISSQANQFGVEVLAMTAESSDLCSLKDDLYENTPLDLEFDSLGSPLENSSSSWISANCSNHQIILVCEEELFSSQEPPATSVSTNAEREYSPEESPVVLLEVSATDEENQSLSSPDNAESNSSNWNQHCDAVCEVSVPENQSLRSPPDNAESNSPDRNQYFDGVCEVSVSETGNYSLMGLCRPPERLLSTRKVISPTSQERLCQAMKGVELIGDVNHHKCKGKLQFNNATENGPSAKGEGAEIAKIEGLGALGGSKITIKPKGNTSKKNSPPKGSQKRSDPPRSLPNFSTGTRSLEKYSQSAIAFSQRQMHDFECLATKLMQELNSMKDIVEGKLHREAYPTEILKYDVDEVKMAVKSAKKAEETTRKWLSMMTRDCNRFCTIMKLSEKGEVDSPNKTNKERRKITFADEAGGVLCQVKVYEDSTASMDSQR